MMKTHEMFGTMLKHKDIDSISITELDASDHICQADISLWQKDFHKKKHSTHGNAAVYIHIVN